MTDVLVDPLSVLEFTVEFPCGGNVTPHWRLCPDKAVAVVVNSHSESCNPQPQNWKCLKCYAEWLKGKGSAVYAQCFKCGLQRPIYEWYQEI